MDIFSKEDFKSLAAILENICISLYLPMHDKGRETRQNVIRLKNALSEVKTSMAGLHQSAGNSQAMLEPLEALLDDSRFWRNQKQGLAIFASRDIFRVYRLPLSFEELHVVGSRFHLKPVLPLISEDFRFYILAISQNNVQLHRCDRFHVSPLAVGNMPKSLEDALQYDLQQRQLQFHTGAAAVQGLHQRAAMFHGHGVVEDEHKDRVLRYCRQVDGAAHSVMRNDTAPLVLAGVDYLLSIYREANTYPHLKNEAIIGNPDHLSVDELHRQGWAIVNSEIHTWRNKALARYHELKGTGYTANSVPAIVRSAIEGRIDQLLVGLQLHCWGKCDETGREVVVHSDLEQVPGDLDLLDVAACETLLKGGEVYPIDREQLPDQAPAVAILRY